MESKEIFETLIKGLSLKSRDDGTVHQVKGADEKTTVAEICVGKTGKIRMNLPKALSTKAPKGLDLTGSKSHTWLGGGAVITEENLPAAIKVLEFVVAEAKAEEPAPAAETPASETAGRTRGRGRSRQATPASA